MVFWYSEKYECIKYLKRRGKSQPFFVCTCTRKTYRKYELSKETIQRKLKNDLFYTEIWVKPEKISRQISIKSMRGVLLFNYFF